MPSPARLVRLLTVFAACLTLAGCIFPPEMRSRAVDIPKARRSVDPDLAGDYWLVDRDGGFSDYRIVRITLNRDRAYRFAEHGKTDFKEDNSTDDISSKVIALQTRQSGVDVLLVSESEGTIYMLMLRSRAGSWVLFPFIGEMDARLGDGRLAYLDSIAARHGIRLRHAPEDTDQSGAVVLDGRLDRDSLVALFGDPDFLGALRLDPDQTVTLLPADRPLPPLNDRVAWWPDSYSERLGSDRFAMTADELVQPAQLAGKFRDGIYELTVAAQDNGSLLFAYAPRADDGFQRDPVRMRLVDIGEKDRLLAIMEQSESTGPDTPPREVFRYYLAVPGEAGAWSFEPLQLAAHDVSRPLDDAARQARERAASRQGLKLEDSMLGGPLSLARLKALLADPQFQAGLDAKDTASWFDLVPFANEGK